MRNKWISKIPIIIIALSFLVGVYFYPLMPEKMASHWNFNGQINGYMSKFWGLFLMPILSSGMYLLFLAIPKIDPLKENVKKFEKYYSGFIIVLIVFLFYIYFLSIEANLGKAFNMGMVMMPAFAVLIFYMGLLMENSKRNWFIGIRTPWTLDSDKVWEKTHKLGAKLFKAAAVIILVSVLLPEYMFFVFLGSILIAAFIPMIYSYFAYQKEKKK